MKLIRRIALILTVCAGAVYSFESAVPGFVAFSYESMGEESEAKESTEVIAPSKIESRSSALVAVRNQIKSTPLIIHEVGVFALPLHKNSRVILHRALLI